jgi:hypothetical protein
MYRLRALSLILLFVAALVGRIALGIQSSEWHSPVGTDTSALHVSGVDFDSSHVLMKAVKLKRRGRHELSYVMLPVSETSLTLDFSTEYLGLSPGLLFSSHTSFPGARPPSCA